MVFGLPLQIETQIRRMDENGDYTLGLLETCGRKQHVKTAHYGLEHCFPTFLMAVMWGIPSFDTNSVNHWLSGYIQPGQLNCLNPRTFMWSSKIERREHKLVNVV